MMYITNLLNRWLTTSVMAWLILVVVMLSQVSADVVFQFNNVNTTEESPTVTFSTIGYFQAMPHATQYTGMLLQWPMDTGCQFRKMDSKIVDTLRQRKIAQSFESLGIAISWKHAVEHDCFTYAQVAEEAAKFQATLDEDVASPIEIIFMLLPGDLNGGPLDHPYNSRNGQVTDDLPVIDISFLSENDGKSLQQLTSRPNINSVSFNARYEPGPWNAELFSAGYIAFCWTLVSATILLILYTCVRLFIIWKVQQGVVRRGARFYIYLYGIINAGLYAVTQVTFGETYVHSCLHRSSSLVSVIGFLMMMLLWASILTQVYPGRVALLLKVQVYIAMATAILNVILWIVFDVETHTSVMDYRSVAFTVRSIAIPGIQIILGLTFAMFAVKFAKSWYRFHVARDKFMKLSIFSLIGFVSFLFFSLYNVLYQRTDIYSPGPKQISFLNVASQVLAFIRMAVILCIFGFKIPKRSALEPDWNLQSNMSGNDQDQMYPAATKYSGINSKHIHQLMNDKHPMQNVSSYNTHVFEKDNCSTISDSTLYENNQQKKAASTAKTGLASALFYAQWCKTKQEKPDNSDRFIGISSAELLDYQNTKQQMMTPNQSMHDISVAIAESVKHNNNNNNGNNTLEEPIRLSELLAPELSQYTDDNTDMKKTSNITVTTTTTTEEPFFSRPNHTLQSILELPHLEETAEAMEVEETILNNYEAQLRTNIRFSKFPMRTPVAGAVVNCHRTPIATSSDVTNPTLPERATMKTTQQSHMSNVSPMTSRDLFQAHPNKYI